MTTPVNDPLLVDVKLCARCTREGAGPHSHRHGCFGCRCGHDVETCRCGGCDDARMVMLATARTEIARLGALVAKKDTALERYETTSLDAPRVSFGFGPLEDGKWDVTVDVTFGPFADDAEAMAAGNALTLMVQTAIVQGKPRTDTEPEATPLERLWTMANDLRLTKAERSACQAGALAVDRAEVTALEVTECHGCPFNRAGDEPGFDPPRCDRDPEGRRPGDFASGPPAWCPLRAAPVLVTLTIAPDRSTP